MQGHTCRDRPPFKHNFHEFFSDSVKKNSQHVQTKCTLVCKQQAHAGTDLDFTGTDLDLNKASPEFFSEALRKTRSMCKLKRSLVCKQQAYAGTDLDIKQNIP